MPNIKQYSVQVVFALLSVATSASAAVIGDTNIQLPSPTETEELCATNREIYEFIAKGTHAQSLLVTCFTDPVAWDRREGGFLFKVEVMRPFIDRTFSPVEFTEYAAGLPRAIGYENSKTVANAGRPGIAEKKATDALVRSSPQAVDYSVKKGTWQQVESSEKSVMIVMLSSVRLETSGLQKEREVATVMSFVNVKGKLLTLKLVNSKDERDPARSAILNMRTWLDMIFRANGR